jgi:hypothetical protein
MCRVFLLTLKDFADKRFFNIFFDFVKINSFMIQLSERTFDFNVFDEQSYNVFNDVIE